MSLNLENIDKNIDVSVASSHLESHQGWACSRVGRAACLWSLRIRHSRAGRGNLPEGQEHRQPVQRALYGQVDRQSPEGRRTASRDVDVTEASNRTEIAMLQTEPKPMLLRCSLAIYYLLPYFIKVVFSGFLLEGRV